MMILITMMMIMFKNMMMMMMMMMMLMMMMICRREVKNGEALLPSWSTWRGSTLCTRFRSQRSWWPWWWWWWWHWFSIVWHCRWRMMMGRWFRSESSTVTLKEISTWRRRHWYKDDYRWLQIVLIYNFWIRSSTVSLKGICRIYNLDSVLNILVWHHTMLNVSI